MTDTSAELEMLAHIRATVSPDTEYRSRLLDDLKSIHIVTPDDDKIEAELDLLVASILAGSSVAYALTITGKSGLASRPASTGALTLTRPSPRLKADIIACRSASVQPRRPAPH